ncbi:MAG: DUF6151 family protein [Polyangiaceae bacterium]
MTTAQSDLPLRCRCGQVRGVVHEASRATGNRLVCLCLDCQAFAKFLNRADTIDAYGGSDIYQMAPARLKITDGDDQLRSMRLSERGLLRWYTDCCKTPVGNTMNGKLPFVGLILAFADPVCDRDGILGKSLGYVNAPDPKKLPPGIELGSNLKILKIVGRCGGLMIGWWISGKASPSPFFDERTREPIAAPKILSKSERDALPRKSTTRSSS